MAIKLEKIPLELLLSYQRVIEMSSLQMRDFADNVELDVNNHLVSRIYFEDLLEKLKIKVDFNNEVDEAIQKEVDSRLKKAFSSKISTPNDMIKFFEKYEEEKTKFKKEVEDRRILRESIEAKHTKKIIKLNTDISNEKKIE